MILHTDIIQYEPAWWDRRRGLPTASSAHRVLTPGGRNSNAWDSYIAELVRDVEFPGQPSGRGGASEEMREGNRREPESRDWYAWTRDVDVTEVGGCQTDCGRFWASPDGLVGEDGGLELKNPSEATHAAYLESPAELLKAYRPQVHFALVVTGRAWWDLVSYCPPREAVVVRVVPAEYTHLMRGAMEGFWKRYASALREKKLHVPGLHVPAA